MAVNRGTDGGWKVGELILKGGVRIFSGAGAPTDGTSGTGAGKANKGSLYLDRTNAKIYYNTNTQASPTWNDIAAIVASEIGAGAVLPEKLGIQVINKTGGSIAIDKLVALSGLDATSGKPKIVLADADVDAHDDIWVTTAAIADNAEGVVVKGALSAANLNTNAAVAAGDPAYLDVTAGGFVFAAPTGATARVIPVGFVVVKSATVGQIRWSISQTRKIGSSEVQSLAVTLAKIALGILEGSVVANVADANLIGGIPVLHRINVPAGVTGDVDTVLTHKTRIVEAWLVKTVAAGGGAGTIQLKNGATAITDAMSINVADQTVVRAGTIDDAQHEIAAAGTLKITRTRTASTDESCTVYALGIRVA